MKTTNRVIGRKLRIATPTTTEERLYRTLADAEFAAQCVIDEARGRPLPEIVIYETRRSPHGEITHHEIRRLTPALPVPAQDAVL